MTFLLDTIVLEELRRSDKANPEVMAWASSVPTTATFLSVVTILEIELGALSIARRDEPEVRILRDWIDRQVLPRIDAAFFPSRRSWRI